MTYIHTFVLFFAVAIAGVVYGVSHGAASANTEAGEPPIPSISTLESEARPALIVLSDTSGKLKPYETAANDIEKYTEENGETVVSVEAAVSEEANEDKEEKAVAKSELRSLPFFSQFNDISDAGWQKVGCGIASLAMIIEHYEPGEVSVDALLRQGIDSGAYLNNAGWIHQGLINLAGRYGLSGNTRDLSGSSNTVALDELSKALEKSPVIASVHYTFEPTNPIPHLVVVTGVNGDTVYYNDPAEARGGGSISADKFLKAWKKRYIAIYPTS